MCVKFSAATNVEAKHLTERLCSLEALICVINTPQHCGCETNADERVVCKCELDVAVWCKCSLFAWTVPLGCDYNCIQRAVLTLLFRVSYPKLCLHAHECQCCGILWMLAPIRTSQCLFFFFSLHPHRHQVTFLTVGKWRQRWKVPGLKRWWSIYLSIYLSICLSMYLSHEWFPWVVLAESEFSSSSCT